MFAFVAITKLSFLIGSPSVYAFVTQLDCDHSVGVITGVQIEHLQIVVTYAHLSKWVPLSWCFPVCN